MCQSSVVGNTMSRYGDLELEDLLRRALDRLAAKTFLTLPGHFRGPGRTTQFAILGRGGRLILRQVGATSPRISDLACDGGALVLMADPGGHAANRLWMSLVRAPWLPTGRAGRSLGAWPCPLMSRSCSVGAASARRWISSWRVCARA